MTCGEIWLVNLDPTIGSEIRKTRPCVVVSPAEMHDHLRTALVAPMTTAGREAPFRIGVTHGGRKGLILLDQVRAHPQLEVLSEARPFSFDVDGNLERAERAAEAH